MSIPVSAYEAIGDLIGSKLLQRAPKERDRNATELAQHPKTITAFHAARKVNTGSGQTQDRITWNGLLKDQLPGILKRSFSGQRHLTSLPPSSS
ncbi:MAG TPA: hypothetical protein VIH58_13690 [Chthoniobacterales bacterium]